MVTKHQRAAVAQARAARWPAAGHLCLFLPKFHCGLNSTEFFWGMAKKYLQDNCDYTFNTPKENMPKALASVPLQTIRRWENQMYRWMEAYRSGLGTKDAQIQVHKSSSTTYKSLIDAFQMLSRVLLTKHYYIW